MPTVLFILRLRQEEYLRPRVWYIVRFFSLKQREGAMKRKTQVIVMIRLRTLRLLVKCISE